MSIKNSKVGTAGAVLLGALSASLCCISPVLAMAAGTGSTMANFSWLAPYRPFFIGVSVLALGIAWLQFLKPTVDKNCGCEHSKKSFLNSKQFLGAITILSFILISFPSYSKIFYGENPPALKLDQDGTNKIELNVKGMTCVSCELHIENEVKGLTGVTFVEASYEKKKTIVRYDDQKIDKEKIIAAINGIGYKVEQTPVLLDLGNKSESCCSKGTCDDHKDILPTEENKNLKVMRNLAEIQTAFNQQKGKTRFVAILSSTCGWCIQGAEAINQTVIENMQRKGIEVMIIWTNMVKTDDLKTAYKGASLFKNPRIIQYFDSKNDFGDLVAKRLSSKGQLAWDIYMFFDEDIVWDGSLPRPFDYAHQLSPAIHTWVDKTKYFCGPELTKRLDEIVSTL